MKLGTDQVFNAALIGGLAGAAAGISNNHSQASEDR